MTVSIMMSEMSALMTNIKANERGAICLEDIKSKLLKIKALAENTPFEHEKESALAHLHRLMEKHGITESDLKKENTFYIAFVNKHQLYGKGSKDGKVSPDEYYKLRQMMDGMDDATPIKVIEEKISRKEQADEQLSF